MKSISMQFHATPDELFKFLWEVGSELSLNIIVASLRPFKLKKISSFRDIELLATELGENRYLRTHLLVKDADCSADTPNDFLDLNKGCTVVNMGNLSDSGLEESSFMFRSEDEQAAEVAKKIASKLKKASKAGVLAINPVNKVEVLYKSHRYTDGAKHLYDAGVKLLPLAGNSLLKIPSYASTSFQSK